MHSSYNNTTQFPNRIKFMAFHTIARYPSELIPEYDKELRCKHGNAFNKHNPVKHKWITKKNAKIHKKSITIGATVYYRPTVATVEECTCRQHYEGDKDLLFNVNNNHLFTYEWLVDLMHNCIESKMPIMASFRSANSSRYFFNQEILKEKMYDHLRRAYNSFIRCFAIDKNPHSFNCLQCPAEGPVSIVMDGMQMGCDKDRMATNEVIENQALPIPEFEKKYRVLFNNKTRKGLKSYTRKARGHLDCVAMDEGEFEVLLNDLPRSFRDLLREAGPYCPVSLRDVLGELSRPNPTCGIFQIAGDDARTAREILEEIANGDFARLETHLQHLKKYAPLLMNLVQSEEVPQYLISEVMKDILHSAKLPLRAPIPEDDCYGTPATKEQLPLDCFPAHEPCRGKAKYAADSINHNETNCRKLPNRHRTLSEGVFTMFCNHGFCLGFTLMGAPESPRTAFDILMTKFNEMPRNIIYDDACHLHLFALKREPARFKNTRFMVDRFHARGHLCTNGYDMKKYVEDDTIRTLNSQLAEQNNAHLRNLNSQIACMPSDNAIIHLSMFLGFRNLFKNYEYENSQ